MSTEYSILLDSEKPESIQATRGKRFLNYLIDFVILFALSAAFGMLMEYQGYNVEEWNWWQEYLFGVVVLIIYYTVFESIFAKSPAKFITRTHVINSHGARPDFAQILGRSLARCIPFDPISFLGDGKWHDAASKTTVVND